MLILRVCPVGQTQATATARLVTSNLTHLTDHLRSLSLPACELSLVSSLRPVRHTKASTFTGLFIGREHSDYFILRSHNCFLKISLLQII
jgi:hypothetical protein